MTAVRGLYGVDRQHPDGVGHGLNGDGNGLGIGLRKGRDRDLGHGREGGIGAGGLRRACLAAGDRRTQGCTALWRCDQPYYKVSRTAEAEVREPLLRMEPGGEGPLVEAAHRLERAVARLEGALAHTPDASPAAHELEARLQAAQRRERQFEDAAAAASQALGRAMSQVALALSEDEALAEDEGLEEDGSGREGETPLEDDAAPEPDRLDLALESAPGLHDEHEGGGERRPPQKEPTE